MPITRGPLRSSQVADAVWLDGRGGSALTVLRAALFSVPVLCHAGIRIQRTSSEAFEKVRIAMRWPVARSEPVRPGSSRARTVLRACGPGPLLARADFQKSVTRSSNLDE